MLNDITIGKCDVISTLFGREEKILYKQHIVHCSEEEGTLNGGLGSFKSW